MSGASPRDVSDSNDTPIPVVLVVGDITGPFGKQAWNRIAKEYHDRIGPDVEALFDWERFPAASATKARELLQPFVQNVRDKYPNCRPFPIPIPVDQGETRRDARMENTGHSILHYLAEFDVWAVIACGPASHTHALLYEDAAPLRRLSRPVFVTADSTSKPIAVQDRPHILHLMPSNFQQAEAIVNHLQGRVEEVTQVRLFAPQPGDPYISDMYRALVDRLYLTDIKAIEIRSPELDERDTTVIYIGYYDNVVMDANFKKRDGSHDATSESDNATRSADETSPSSESEDNPPILTDGCFRMETVNWLEELGTGAPAIYGCRPNRSPEQYAFEVFLAIREAFQDIEHDRKLHLNTLPPTPGKLETLRSRVETILVNRHSTRYSFADAVNRKAGFSVDHLAEPRNLKRWRRLLEATHDTSANGNQAESTETTRDPGEQRTRPS